MVRIIQNHLDFPGGCIALKVMKFLSHNLQTTRCTLQSLAIDLKAKPKTIFQTMVNTIDGGYQQVIIIALRAKH